MGSQNFESIRAKIVRTKVTPFSTNAIAQRQIRSNIAILFDKRATETRMRRKLVIMPSSVAPSRTNLFGILRSMRGTSFGIRYASPMLNDMKIRVICHVINSS